MANFIKHYIQSYCSIWVLHREFLMPLHSTSCSALIEKFHLRSVCSELDEVLIFNSYTFLLSLLNIIYLCCKWFIYLSRIIYIIGIKVSKAITLKYQLNCNKPETSVSLVSSSHQVQTLNFLIAPLHEQNNSFTQ